MLVSYTLDKVTLIRWHRIVQLHIHLFTLCLINLYSYVPIYQSHMIIMTPWCNIRFIWDNKLPLSLSSFLPKVWCHDKLYGMNAILICYKIFVNKWMLSACNMLSIFLSKHILKAGCAHFDMFLFTLNWLTLIPKTDLVQFYLKVASYLLSWETLRIWNWGWGCYENIKKSKLVYQKYVHFL